jgi:hypothetical protein
LNLDRYKKEVANLVKRGWDLYFSISYEVTPAEAKQFNMTDEQRGLLPKFRQNYQAWYSEALAVLHQLMPERVDDFVAYYKPLRPRKELNASTYTISDLLQGITLTQGDRTILGFDAAIMLVQQQAQIVAALERRFESSLFDIRTVAQADLFDNELEAAEELNKKGFSRGGGAIAGVVLEGHLATICEQRKITAPKNPTLSVLNDLLRKNDVIEVSVWRQIQRFGDIRNLCDHKKSAEPTREQVSELITGVRKTIKTIF